MKKCLRITVVTAVVFCMIFAFQTSNVKPVQIPVENPQTAVAFIEPEEACCMVEEVEFMDVEFENPYDQMIYYAAKDTLRDPYLAIAISRLETGHYTSEAFLRGHNFGGITVTSGVKSFDTVQEGLYRFINLLEWYQSKGMDTAEKMQPVYCPPNKHWDEVVNSLYKKFP